MNRRFSWTVVLATAPLVSLTAMAFDGRWEGMAAVRGAPMPVVLDVVMQGGAPRAWVTLPGRGHKGLVLPAELRAGGVLRLDVTPAFAQMGPPSAVPEMLLSPEAGGTQLRGHFAQAGHQAPLQLVRTGPAQTEREVANDAVPADLAGIWRGGYTIGTLPRQVTLTLIPAAGGNPADRGSARAVIVGRRTVEVPFDGIEIGQHAITLTSSAYQISFEMRRLAAGAAGSGAGAEMTGQFTQGPYEAALQLRREVVR